MKKAPEKLLRALKEAESLKAANKMSKAAYAGRQAYGWALEYLPSGHPERRRAAKILGTILMGLGRQVEAEKLLLESGVLEVDGDLEEQMAARNSRASLKIQGGLDAETRQAVSDNLEFARAHLPPESSGTILALNNAGKVAEIREDWRAAEGYFADALRLARAAQEQGLLVHILLDLARIYLRCDRLSKSETLFREALHLQEASGEEGIALAITLNQYGAVCHRLGRREEAESHLERSLALRRSILGEDHPQVATALHGLAVLYLDSNQAEKAEATLEKAWRITDRSLGASHPKALEYLVERAGCIVIQSPQRIHEAIQLVRQADRLSSHLPGSDPTRWRVLQNLTRLEALQKELDR